MNKLKTWAPFLRIEFNFTGCEFRFAFTCLMYQLHGKMIIQEHFNVDFMRKKYFACTEIQTHDLPTRVFLPGRYLPYKNLYH